jgi:hypothetical protein
MFLVDAAVILKPPSSTRRGRGRGEKSRCPNRNLYRTATMTPYYHGRNPASKRGLVKPEIRSSASSEAISPWQKS